MNCTSNIFPQLDASLSPISLIACIIALGAQLFFKMYHNFLYRLLLYTFATLIFLSFIWSIQSILLLAEDAENRTQNNCSTEQNVSFKVINYTTYSSLCTIYLLLTSLNVCLYLLSIHHYLFSSWVADLIFLLMCLLLPQPFTLPITIACGITSSWKPLQDCPCATATFVPLVVAATIVLLVNIIFTTLALLPVCCRACGYNRCVMSVATRESLKRALKEILPPVFIFLLYTCIAIISLVIPGKWESIIASHLTGLFLALSFATHLCILGKAKLKKLRGRSLATHQQYGSTVVQQHTHRTTVFTSEGISETCNTDFPHVSEDAVDRELLRTLQ